MPNRTRLLEQIHFGTVFVGSAAVVAFLGSIFDGPQPPEPRYAYEIIDGMRCVVETGSNTFIASSDGEPECTPVTPATTRIAQHRPPSQEQGDAVRPGTLGRGVF